MKWLQRDPELFIHHPEFLHQHEKGILRANDVTWETSSQRTFLVITTTTQ
jgi:hypothetical protein